jgi:hypothetical protein
LISFALCAVQSAPQAQIEETLPFQKTEGCLLLKKNFVFLRYQRLFNISLYAFGAACAEGVACAKGAGEEM